MTDLLNTGKSALFAYQRALSTTAHNISNVNTEGYSRQRVHFDAVPGNPKDTMPIGRGVEISTVQRMSNQFANSRITNATSAYQQQNVHHEMASRLDTLVATDGMSVAAAISDFFNALHDANMDPSSNTTREILVDRTEQLSHRFRALDEQFSEAQAEVNSRTDDAIKSIDYIAESIATLNKKIISSQGASISSGANDLLDQRDKLIQELSEFVDVDVVQQDFGSVNVYIGNGLFLVNNTVAESISTTRNITYPDRLDIQIGEGNNTQIVTSNLQGGRIGGLNEFVVDTLHPAKQQLGHLALNLANNLNEQHNRGLDARNRPGNDLFDIAGSSIYASTKNTGSGDISVNIVDTSLLEVSDYIVSFDGGSYTATRESDGTSVTSAMPITMDGLEFSVTGSPSVGDRYVVSVTSTAAGTLQSLLKNPEDLALSGQLSTRSSIANIGDTRISEASVLDPADPALTTPVEIRFTSSNTFDIVDSNSGSTLTGGVTYVEGGDISVNGWQVSISGQAQAGDTHAVEPNVNGNGNNSNGEAMERLQNSFSVGGNQTFNDAYGSFVARIGSQTNSAKTRSDALETLMNDAVDKKMSFSGVSLDEEAIDLTRYQQAYQASAQIITIADELFDAILGAVQ